MFKFKMKASGQVLLALRERIGLLGDEVATKSSMEERASARF
jgi:hypothetical protein